MADWVGSIPDALLPSSIATGGDISFLEGVRGGYEIGRSTQSRFIPSNIVHDLLQPTIDELNARGEDLRNPGTYLNRSGASEQLDSLYDDYWFQHHLGRLNDAIARNGGDGTDPITVDTLKKQVRLRAQEVETYADEMGIRTTTLGEVGSLVGQFGAAGVDILDDVTTLPFFVSGFVKNVTVAGSRLFTTRMAAKRALIEGMIGMGTEAWVQAGVAKWRKEFGLNYDFGDFVTAVGMSGVLGGALGGAVEAGSVVARGGRMGIMAREIARSVDETTLAQINQRMLNLSDDAIVSGARALRAAGVDVSPELKFAADERQAGEEIIRVNPLAGEDADIEHVRRAIEADVALKAGVPEAMPTVTPIARVKTPVDIYEADNLDETVYRFRPDEIGVDAKTFQFKEGGDEFGVTERLAGVTKWDPIKAGQIVVYEFADGRRVIADGHQRLGLAKRIMAQDPSQKPVIYGSLIREADGFSPDQARLIAALKNIAEGTGTAVDAAKVLRIDPARLSELPPRSQLVRQAQDLVNLSDEAFGLVINGVTAPHYAAIVGRLVPDQAKQMAILRLLSDADPQNVIQAEAIIRQALEADFEQAVQVGLFGEELITESLFKERARVLDAALKTLRKDRAIFNSLVENQSRIEGAGNVLDQAENLQRSTTDAQAIALIQKVANRRGDLSDALSAAARELKQSGSIREPSRSFVEAVRRSIERGDFNGVDAGGEGRFVDVEAEGDLIAASPRQDELDRFDDPIHGEGVSRQADQLEQDMFGDDPATVQQADEGLRQDLKRLVDEGASPEQIEAHPAVVDAIERAKAIPETHLAEGYGSDEWIASREFNIDGQTVRGYDAAVERHYEHAGKFAGQTEIVQGRRAVIVLGPPASGKSAISDPLARARGARVIDSDEVKKTLPEYGDGTGAHAVHEESSDITTLVLQRALENGDNIVIPKVGDNASKIDRLATVFENMGYKVDLIVMNVSPDEAYRRNISRFIGTGRLVPPAYVRSVGLKPVETLNTLKTRFERYAEIDNNGEIGAAKAVLQRSEQDALEGVDLRLRDGRGEDPGQVRSLGETARPQVDETLIPVGQRIDPDTGELVPEYKSKAELLDEIRQDEAMLARFEGCVA